MALRTILASFIKPTTTRISDPEKGQTSPTNRDFLDSVNNNQGDHLDVGRDMNVDVDNDPDDGEGDDGSEPDDSDSRPQPETNEHQRILDGASLFARFKSFMFPPSSDDSSSIPNYRHLPLISGIVIPFSILLGIPGLTAHWYIRTQNFNTVETRPNPAILDAGLAISMTCAIVANICIITRFLEKRVMAMTLSCILFLSIHDIINIVAVTVFGVSHRFNDGFTYSEAFWMTICSTVAALTTNVTLIIDFIRTPNFKTSGSGLTRKQRTLMIILIFLFFYIALGSMINSFLLSLTFINGLYFTVTTIETIGFGDIAPDSTASRIFTCFYAAFGIINIAVVIGMVQETMKEGSRISYLRRLQEIRARRRAALRQKRAERRWRSAVIWRLREKGAPVWVRERDPQRRKSLLANVLSRVVRTAEKIPHPMGRRRGMRLNLEVLTRTQLEAAAMEAGVPLDTLLPPSFYKAKMENEGDDHVDDDNFATSRTWWPISHPVYGADMRGERRTLTDQQLGAMATLLTRFAVVFAGGRRGEVPQAAADNLNDPVGGASLRNDGGDGDGDGGDQSPGSSTTIAFTTTQSDDDVSKDYLTMVGDMEKQALYLRSGLAWLLFAVFWMVGSVIFSLTEGWSYGISIYFCFVSFTTIGYGDPAPKTPAGRSLFVVWALLGVGAVSVFISAASEAYAKRYKGMLENSAFERAVTRYRNQMKQQNYTRAWSQAQSLLQVPDLTPTQPQALPGPPNVRFQSRVPSIPSAGLRHRASQPPELNMEGSEGSQRPSERVRDSGISVEDTYTRVQRLLEELPQHVLNEAHSFQEHARYLTKCDGFSGSSYMNERLKALLDDVVRTEGMKKSVEADVLRDKGNLRTLFVLSIEKSLVELISLAEGAIAAINERDRITAAVQKKHEDSDEADEVRG